MKLTDVLFCFFFAEGRRRSFTPIYEIMLSVLYFSFNQERTATLSALAEKAKLTEQVLNTVQGISCNPVQGAMYSFPCITIPEKAIKEATVSPLHSYRCFSDSSSLY